MLSSSVVSNSLQPYGLYSLPGFTVHGIFQARILEWVAISSSKGTSRPRINLSPVSPALQVDSLPTEPWGNTCSNNIGKMSTKM